MSPFVAKVAGSERPEPPGLLPVRQVLRRLPRRLADGHSPQPDHPVRPARAEEDLLESEAIWVCASCMTCNVRCPKGINIAEVIEASGRSCCGGAKDHVEVKELSGDERADVPPIALISSLRKFTS